MYDYRFLFRTLVALGGLLIATACGSSSNVDRVTEQWTVGSVQRVSLQFVTQEQGILGEELRDNVHFDDEVHQRVVLYYDEAMRSRVTSLQTGQVVALTFEIREVTPLMVGMLRTME